jgi:beta-phosphoglucomutase-like phosphatase (HAD superfamily)
MRDTDSPPALQRLVLPAGDFRACLFDCDGTIADSMPVHYRAWSQALAEHGGALPKDIFYAWAGIPLTTTVEMLNERLGLAMPVEEVVRRKEQLYFELLPEVRPMASVLEHIDYGYGRVAFAVVSGSPHASVLKTLRYLGLEEKFPVIVGQEDYMHGKPDPEPFLRAAELLGLPPAECLVFEDAEAGI